MNPKDDTSPNLLELAKKLTEVDPDDPAFDQILEQLANLDPGDSTNTRPHIFDLVENPEIPFQHFQAAAKENLHAQHEGRTLLQAAARSGSLEKVKWLVEQGLDPHHIDESGYSLVLHAIYSSSPQIRPILDHLLKLGCNLDQTSKYGESPLSVSLRHGQYPQALYLIQHGANPDLIGFTSLHQAAASGDLEFIEKLPPNTGLEPRDRWERTPWLTALAANQVPAAIALTKKGARQDVIAHHNDTPLSLCACSDANHSVHYLLNTLSSPSKCQPFLDHQNSFGDTALHSAAAWNSLKVARLMLTQGASVDIQNSVQSQPINEASDLAMFQLLHEFGADLNHVDGCGEWPLKEAAENDNLPALLWLLNNGAQVDQTSTGETALHAACRHSSPDVVQALLNAGADVNATDVDGDSALFCCKSVEAAQLLIDAGIDTTLQDMCGDTASQAPHIDQRVRDFLTTK